MADKSNASVINEFRDNEGRVGGVFEDITLAIITTVGAKTGRCHTVPLGYLVIDSQPLIIATWRGRPKHPAWYLNIVKNPEVTVEVGTETYQAFARITEGQERDRLFAKAAEMIPEVGASQARTTRLIPVVTLHRKTD